MKKDRSDRISEASTLDFRLRRATDVLKLLKQSQSITGISKERNNLIDLTCVATIKDKWECDRESEKSATYCLDKNFTNKIAIILIPLFEEKIKKLNKKLNSLIKKP